MNPVLFDVLQVAGKDVLRDPWRSRRERLEDLVAGAERARWGRGRGAGQR